MVRPSPLLKPLKTKKFPDPTPNHLVVSETRLYKYDMNAGSWLTDVDAVIGMMLIHKETELPDSFERRS